MGCGPQCRTETRTLGDPEGKAAPTLAWQTPTFFLRALDMLKAPRYHSDGVLEDPILDYKLFDGPGA